VYIFKRMGDAFSYQTVLLPGDLTESDQFGKSVSLDDSTLVAGAHLASTHGIYSFSFLLSKLIFVFLFLLFVQALLTCILMTEQEMSGCSKPFSTPARRRTTSGGRSLFLAIGLSLEPIMKTRELHSQQVCLDLSPLYVF
jgi:hypothetical protein